jgi:hypothetical protein
VLRIFLLVGICALLPITAQTIFSFSKVTAHLREQIRMRLPQPVKSFGKNLFERLLLNDATLNGIAAHLRAASHAGVF